MLESTLNHLPTIPLKDGGGVGCSAERRHFSSMLSDTFFCNKTEAFLSVVLQVLDLTQSWADPKWVIKRRAGCFSNNGSCGHACPYICLRLPPLLLLLAALPPRLPHCADFMPGSGPRRVFGELYGQRWPLSGRWATDIFYVNCSSVDKVNEWHNLVMFKQFLLRKNSHFVHFNASIFVSTALKISPKKPKKHSAVSKNFQMSQISRQCTVT